MMEKPSGPASATNPSAKAMPYALGASDRERRRLMLQGAILRAPLEAAFRAAGIGPGMRVLDIGCRVGDVALLAADLVGPSGFLVGRSRCGERCLGSQARGGSRLGDYPVSRHGIRLVQRTSLV